MVNLDADQLEPGDLTTLKSAGVRISNPETTKPICVNCEFLTFGKKVAEWFEDNDDDDDSSFFGGFGLGSTSFGGFGGRIGGGGFGGGGASRGF